MVCGVFGGEGVGGREGINVFNFDFYQYLSLITIGAIREFHQITLFILCMYFDDLITYCLTKQVFRTCVHSDPHAFLAIMNV